MKEEIKGERRKEGKEGEREGEKEEEKTESSLPYFCPSTLLPFSTVHHVTSSQLLAVPVVTTSAEVIFFFRNHRPCQLSCTVLLGLCPPAQRDIPLFGLPFIRALQRDSTSESAL